MNAFRERAAGLWHNRFAPRNDEAGLVHEVAKGHARNANVAIKQTSA